MVSFWPWKSSGSPESFEKALSGLSTKIASTQAQLDATRSTSRRLKVLWTLYLTFAYLVYAIVLFLVVGLNGLGPLEWTGLAGGPVVIYVVRTALAAFFNFRVETLSTRLADQQAERASTIQKLKDATKYDSTLELLNKYGGEEPSAGGKDGEAPDSEQKKQRKEQRQGHPDKRQHPRTNIAPPPTANIRRPATAPDSPPAPQHDAAPQPDVGAEFAPNAFGPGGPTPPALPPYPSGAALPAGPADPHWYDRILDLLLGEDETAAKNRIVLLCSHCRLVNGQAPPGAKTLADVGAWKCMACGAVNGEPDEGRRIVQEVLASSSGRQSAPSADGDSSDLVEVGKEDGDESVEDVDEPKRKGKGSKKG